MTDDELEEIEAEGAKLEERGYWDTWCLRLAAEVRRLRLGVGAVVPYVGRPPAWRTGEELDRLEAAERLAEADIALEDATDAACSETRDWMSVEAAGEQRAQALDAYRKARG